MGLKNWNKKKLINRLIDWLYLGEHEEVSQSCHTEPDGGAEDDEADEVVAAGRVLVLEGHDSQDQAAATITITITTMANNSNNNMIMHNNNNNRIRMNW